MKEFLLDILSHPVTKEKFRLIGSTLVSSADSFAITNGIPRFIQKVDPRQEQTKATFSYKWKRQDSYNSPAMRKISLDWCLKKYGFSTVEEWATFFGSYNRILDIGCGSGYTTSLWIDKWEELHPSCMWVGLDISDAIDLAKRRLDYLPQTNFIQADALNLPFPNNTFDLIFSEGVLHHTPSVEKAIQIASEKLKMGGEFHFYIYKRKAVPREAVDDSVRNLLVDLSDSEAWEVIKDLTEVARLVSESCGNQQIKITRTSPKLRILKGVSSLQRFIYYNLIKLYWNSNLSFDENVHLNFDWYRPQYAWRTSEKELRRFCTTASLDIEWLSTQGSGFTVKARKV